MLLTGVGPNGAPLSDKDELTKRLLEKAGIKDVSADKPTEDNNKEKERSISPDIYQTTTPPPEKEEEKETNKTEWEV